MTSPSATGFEADLLAYWHARDTARMRMAGSIWQALTDHERVLITRAAQTAFQLGRPYGRDFRTTDRHIVTMVLDECGDRDLWTGTLNRRERRLYREAAVMGFVQGTHWAVDEQAPDLDTQVFIVVDACRACGDSGRYPALNHVTDAKSSRRWNTPQEEK